MLGPIERRAGWSRGRVALTASLALAMAGCGGSAPPPSDAAAATPVATQTARAEVVTPRPSTAPPTIAPATPAPTPSGPLPAPTGVAANGLILYSTTVGDIMSVDVSTGTIETVIGGDTFDEAPNVSPDGHRFYFGRRAAGGGFDIWVANVDGAGPRMVIPGPTPPEFMSWSPGSDRIAAIPNGGGKAAIYDIASGARTGVDVPDPVRTVLWRSDDSLIIGMEPEGPQGPTTFAIGNVDGSDLTNLTTAPGTTWAATLSPDGLRLAYMTWGVDPAIQGQIRILDLESGADTLRTKVDPSFVWEQPVFSPDGRWIKVDRFDASDKPLRLALLPADGPIQPVVMGPAQSVYDDGATAVFSPDGASVLVTYNQAHETYLFDIASGTGSKVDWPGLSIFASWQRLAP